MVPERITARHEPAVTIEFRPDRQPLPPREEATLEATSEAVRGIGKVYAVQKHLRPYPPLREEEIREAASSNPLVLNEYTRPDDNLTPIFYHEFFREELEEPCRKLEEAASMTRDPYLRRYLLARAQNLRDGNYKESESLWLSMPDESEVDVLIGPYDRYGDKMFNRKYSYMGATGTLDREATYLNQQRVDALLEVWEKIAPPYAFRNPRVRIRVDITEVISGLMADREVYATAQNVPCQQDWREELGSKIIIFDPAFKHRFWNERLPILEEIIAERPLQDQTPEFLEECAYIWFDAHETNHSTTRRKGDEERLGNLYTVVSEMTSTTFGLSQLPHIGISAQQLEGVLAIQCAITAHNYQLFSESGGTSRAAYMPGDSMIFNYLLKNGSIEIDERGRIGWRNIAKVYQDLEEYGRGSLEGLITEGTYQDAGDLQKSLYDLEPISTLAAFRPKNQPLQLNFQPTV